MLTISEVEVSGWKAAIRGARNAMNSWDRMDTTFHNGIPVLGINDTALLSMLADAGDDHGKFLRMIHVSLDITAMQPWWAEWDTYKVGTTRNSCSKMHKIHVKEFCRDDFAHQGCDEVDYASEALDEVLATCELLRQDYNNTHEKRYWRALIELLPEGYRMRSTVDLNYAVLKRMYHARRNHKLAEWHTLCEWIEKLPYANELIVGKKKVDA